MLKRLSPYTIESAINALQKLHNREGDDQTDFAQVERDIALAEIAQICGEAHGILRFACSLCLGQDYDALASRVREAAEVAIKAISPDLEGLVGIRVWC